MTSEPDGPRIFTGSVYDPPDAPYFRYLVSRTWPPGLERGAVDQWDRELAPSTALLEAWSGSEIDDATFEKRYEAELEERPSLIGWAARVSENGVVLVDDADAEPSPRSVLASILTRRVEAMRNGD